MFSRNKSDASSAADDVASYGMGSTWGDSTMAADDARSVEVSDYYGDPLSLGRPGSAMRPPQYSQQYGGYSAAPPPSAARMATTRRPHYSQPPPPQPQPAKSNIASSARLENDRQVSFTADTKKKDKKDRKKKRYNPNLPESTRDNANEGACWRIFCRICTCLIPDSFLWSRTDASSKQAWREKMTIFQIFVWCNIFFLIVFGVLPLYFCRVKEGNIFEEYDWFQSSIDDVCNGLEIATYVIIFTVAVLMALQCLCSLALGLQSFLFRIAEERPFIASEFQENVMVMVPCYNEGERELRKTITSIVDSDYPEPHKVMVVVADGIITGRGEYFNTPTVLANLLGFHLDKRDPAHSYNSLGNDGENRASVYSGVYENDRGRGLKYIVIVKRGTPAEKSSSRPGNRGKRDSQLIVMGLFNRLHHDRKRTDLDKAMMEALRSLEIPLQSLRYLLAIDADTRISSTSISHMVYRMNTKRKVLACCGETKVDNKASSWVTMIQVYEYFASHHLKKSFESVFGCVTCLPGCFTMYRIKTDDGQALFASDVIFQSYRRNDIESLHEKNLYHLGEDRMLTSMMLKYFPEMNLSFVPIASCWTIVPEGYNVLLSQRRRWVNSTFHNMWELLKVNTMCGFLCISMNAVVLLDMLATMILPASVVYGIAFLYAALVDEQGLSLITIILFGMLIGVQSIIFLMRSRLDYIFWFLIYIILGIPVFYFILPIYSFWNMDDFSWGSTRQVRKSKSQKKVKNNEQQDKEQASKPTLSGKRTKRHEQTIQAEYHDRLQSLGAGQTNMSSWEEFQDVENGRGGGSTSSSSSESPLASDRKQSTTGAEADTSPIEVSLGYQSNKGRRQADGSKDQLHDPRRIQARARVGRQTPPPPDGSITTTSSNKRFNHYANLTDLNKGSNDPPTVFERDDDDDSDDEEDNIFRAEI